MLSCFTKLISIESSYIPTFHMQSPTYAIFYQCNSTVLSLKFRIHALEAAYYKFTGSSTCF